MSRKALVPIELPTDPVQPMEAATKQYVDTSPYKTWVRVATAGLNLNLSNTQTVDGVALSIGDRVLVMHQTTKADNGIYIVQSGVWTRAPDMDLSSKVVGARTTVREGTLFAGTTWFVAGSTNGYVPWTILSVLGGADMTWWQADQPPPGSMQIWPGPSTHIPPGWLLCDGRAASRPVSAGGATNIHQNLWAAWAGIAYYGGTSPNFNTPNTQLKFIQGVGGAESVAATGGTASLPKHYHAAITGPDWADGNMSTAGDGAHLHNYDVGGASPGTANAVIQRSSGAVQATIGAAMNTTANHSHTVQGHTASTGTGTADENRPPYVSMYYIVKF